jgi:ACS family hexuronate transporter-like MFS transporter
MSEVTVLRSVKAVTVSSYLSMFFLGVSVSLVGAAARNIGLSPYQIGLLIAVQQVGFILSLSLSGALSDMVEKPKILLVGSLVLGFSFLTFYRSELFWINLVIMFGIGAGMATYEGVTDAMLLDIHPERQSLHINVNHFFVTLGAIMITGYLLFLQINWRQSVIQSGIVVLLLAAFFGLTKLENKPIRADRYLKRLQILTRERILIVLYIAAALAVGVELGSIGILTTFLMELRGFSQVTSKVGLLVFLGGIATGRIFLGFFTRKDQILQYILVLFGLSFLFFTGLYFLNLGGLTYIAVYLAGISLSALLPLILTLAGLLYPDIAGTVLGTIKVAAGLGGILLPFFMSLIANSASLQMSLLVLPVASLLSLFMLFLEIRHIKSFEPGGDQNAGQAYPRYRAH